MGREIERKFLVKSNVYKRHGSCSFHLQGYLNTDMERVVRVRIIGEEAWLTIKGTSTGYTRPEFEYEIPLDDAQFMIREICEQPYIEKHRCTIEYEGFTWEVDDFHGENEGLIVAEIELDYEAQEFPKPDWLGEEVTGDSRYYNANLVKNPYKKWK
jgi:adenylate cyclase